MKHALFVIGMLGMTWAVIGLGMLFAFCPINDKDTSAAHRVVSLLLTGIAVGALWACAS